MTGFEAMFPPHYNAIVVQKATCVLNMYFPWYHGEVSPYQKQKESLMFYILYFTAFSLP